MKLRCFIVYLFVFVIILVLMNIILLSDLINSRTTRQNDYNNLDFKFKVSGILTIFTKHTNTWCNVTVVYSCTVQVILNS